jgi:hypothetical protein
MHQRKARGAARRLLEDFLKGPPSGITTSLPALTLFGGYHVAFTSMDGSLPASGTFPGMAAPLIVIVATDVGWLFGKWRRVKTHFGFIGRFPVENSRIKSDLQFGEGYIRSLCRR